MSELPSGSKIAGIAAHIAVVAFFLPWIAVSCYGTPIGTASGYGMATGNWNTPFGSFDSTPVPSVFLILAGAVLLAFMFYVAYTRESIGVSWIVSQIVIAASSLAALVAISIKTIRENTSSVDATLQVSAHPQMGLMLTIGSFVTVILTCYLTIVDIRRQNKLSMGVRSGGSLAPPMPTKECPYCAETIFEDAIICRYCRKDMTDARDTLAVFPP